MKTIIENKRWLVLIVLVAFFGADIFAQQVNVNQALSTVNQQVRGMFTMAANVMMAVGAIGALVGTIIVFSKWMKGDQGITSYVSNWMYALVFIGIAGIIIRALTGVQG